jgi:DNA-binding beta-propeller fold protein YncE
MDTLCNPDIGRNCDRNAPFAPRGLIRGPSDTLYVADLGAGSQGRVPQYHLPSGKFLGDLDFNGFTGDEFGEFHPRGVVFGPDGLLYVSAVGNLDPENPHFSPLVGWILRFDPDTGGFLDVFASNQNKGRSCARHLHRPEGLIFGPDGNLYVTSFRADSKDTDKILIFDGETGECLDQIDLYDVKHGDPRAFAQALLFGPGGLLFVPINNTGEVRRYDVTTKDFDVFVHSGGQNPPLQQPWYLTFGETDPRTLEYED